MSDNVIFFNKFSKQHRTQAERKPALKAGYTWLDGEPIPAGIAREMREELRAKARRLGFTVRKLGGAHGLWRLDHLDGRGYGCPTIAFALE